MSGVNYQYQLSSPSKQGAIVVHGRAGKHQWEEHPTYNQVLAEACRLAMTAINNKQDAVSVVNVALGSMARQFNHHFNHKKSEQYTCTHRYMVIVTDENLRAIFIASSTTEEPPILWEGLDKLPPHAKEWRVDMHHYMGAIAIDHNGHIAAATSTGGPRLDCMCEPSPVTTIPPSLALTSAMEAIRLPKATGMHDEEGRFARSSESRVGTAFAVCVVPEAALQALRVADACCCLTARPPEGEAEVLGSRGADDPVGKQNRALQRVFEAMNTPRLQAVAPSFAPVEVGVLALSERCPGKYAMHVAFNTPTFAVAWCRNGDANPSSYVFGLQQHYNTTVQDLFVRSPYIYSWEWVV